MHVKRTSFCLSRLSAGYDATAFPNARALSVAVLLAFLSAALMTGCASVSGAPVYAASDEGPAEGEVPDPAPSTTVNTIHIPAHTSIHVRLLQAVSSRSARPGDVFQAELSAPLSLTGTQVFRKGTRINGRIMDARRSGRFHHPGYLRLTLDSIEPANGKRIRISTTSFYASGKSHKKRNLTLIGGGAGLGALVGGLAGGGVGLAIGASSGAAAGATGVFFTGRKDITFPAESRLTFKTSHEFAMKR